jgi:hypothetical protein
MNIEEFKRKYQAVWDLVHDIAELDYPDIPFEDLDEAALELEELGEDLVSVKPLVPSLDYNSYKRMITTQANYINMIHAIKTRREERE